MFASYIWVRDVNNTQYAVHNYLTYRQLQISVCRLSFQIEQMYNLFFAIASITLKGKLLCTEHERSSLRESEGKTC
jgi:hypothetical protein